MILNASKLDFLQSAILWTITVSGTVQGGLLDKEKNSFSTRPKGLIKRQKVMFLKWIKYFLEENSGGTRLYCYKDQRVKIQNSEGLFREGRRYFSLIRLEVVPSIQGPETYFSLKSSHTKAGLVFLVGYFLLINVQTRDTRKYRTHYLDLFSYNSTSNRNFKGLSFKKMHWSITSHRSREGMLLEERKIYF